MSCAILRYLDRFLFLEKCQKFYNIIGGHNRKRENNFHCWLWLTCLFWLCFGGWPVSFFIFLELSSYVDTDQLLADHQPRSVECMCRVERVTRNFCANGCDVMFRIFYLIFTPQRHDFSPYVVIFNIRETSDQWCVCLVWLLSFSKHSAIQNYNTQKKEENNTVKMIAIYRRVALHSLPFDYIFIHHWDEILQISCRWKIVIEFF